jgi:sarcosine oxidase subunit beta
MSRKRALPIQWQLRTHCFARRARDLGATLLEGVAARRILAQGERVMGVETTQGLFFSAPIVVLAANVWSVELAREISIELPITPTRHPMVALRRPDDFGGRMGMHVVCLDTVHNIYLRPDIGGVTLVGSAENVLKASDPDHYAQGLTENEIAYFRHMAGKSFPALARAVPRGGWAGIYDDTPDYHPILGRLAAYEGLYCAAGFSSHGFKLPPIIGHLHIMHSAFTSLFLGSEVAEDQDTDQPCYWKSLYPTSCHHVLTKGRCCHG